MGCAACGAGMATARWSSGEAALSMWTAGGSPPGDGPRSLRGGHADDSPDERLPRAAGAKALEKKQVSPACWLMQISSASVTYIVFIFSEIQTIII